MTSPLSSEASAVGMCVLECFFDARARDEPEGEPRWAELCPSIGRKEYSVSFYPNTATKVYETPIYNPLTRETAFPRLIPLDSLHQEGFPAAT